MSDNEASPMEPTKSSREFRSHWYAFDGKAVVVQLHEPWAGVTYPNDPVIKRDANGAISGLVTVPVLKGICHVYPDGNDVMFVLETSDPNPNNNAMVHIGIKRELVAYITYVERSLVTTERA